MNLTRFKQLTSRFSSLRIAILGDFCLDRYLEIDPRRKERSIETKLPVHNVVNVRAQAGGAGTILNNLVALGVGEIFPVGFCGEDGEGFELQRALRSLRGVSLKHFWVTPLRRTFTYCKPLVIQRGQPPRELNRLDSKNWTATPRGLQETLSASLRQLAPKLDAVIVLDQTDVADTGVVASLVLESLDAVARKHPHLRIIADSRRSLRDFPPVGFKMNAAELATFGRTKQRLSLAQIKSAAASLARRNRSPVFVTLAERGIVGALPDGQIEHLSSLPVRGPIDIVGAGDSVTANLTTALAAGATLREAIELANAGASVVIHQLGTTGTASVLQIRKVLI
jgi:rfaE bifunctional protein kinase chain/domain